MSKRTRVVLGIATAGCMALASFSLLGSPMPAHTQVHAMNVAQAGTISPASDRSAFEAEQSRLAAEAQAKAQADADALRLQQAAAAKAKASRGARHRSSGAYPYVGPPSDDVFVRLSWCEAGGNPTRVSRNGKYFGAWQFSLPTWHSMGMGGSPIDYPYEVQLDVAKRLQARSGWGQWPVCSRKLGLR